MRFLVISSFSFSRRLMQRFKLFTRNVLCSYFTGGRFLNYVLQRWEDSHKELHPLKYTFPKVKNCQVTQFFISS
jgi:hypothetical protein